MKLRILKKWLAVPDANPGDIRNVEPESLALQGIERKLAVAYEGDKAGRDKYLKTDEKRIYTKD
ncbi:MAG: hypothetical protein V1794_05185, partial [Candidatus Glassbacteria bacterium]